MARLFYGRNQLGIIKKLTFYRDPGELHDYNSATTAILGIGTVTNVVGMNAILLALIVLPILLAL